MTSFALNVVGECYDNADGTSRQDEIRRCAVGEPVELRREPSNPADPSAVAVYSARGVQVGYLGASRTAWIGSKLDRGLDVSVAVRRVIGRRSWMPRRLVIEITIDPGSPQVGRSPIDFLAATGYARTRDGKRRLRRITPKPVRIPNREPN